MTEIVYAVINNHRLKKGTSYNIIFKSKKFEEFIRFVNKKGL